MKALAKKILPQFVIEFMRAAQVALYRSRSPFEGV
jgi:hypothetical protein